MSLLPDAIQESDSSLQDISQDVPPTLLALNNYRLPTEIFSQIISHLVPDGLQISNDPACDSDMTTIRALLKTSIKVKHEMLHQIFRYPLRIHISNGKICGCTRIIRGKSTLLLKKISHLPLYRWTSVMISFAPTSQAESCVSRYIYRWQFEKFVDFLEPENQDPLGWNFIHAVDCVKRQSKQIGDALRFHCQPERRDWALSGSPYNRPSIAPLTFDCYDPRYRQSGTPKSNFIFHDPTGTSIPSTNAARFQYGRWPRYCLCSTRWRWTSFQGPFQQAKLPLRQWHLCLAGTQDRSCSKQPSPHDPAICMWLSSAKDFTYVVATVVDANSKTSNAARADEQPLISRTGSPRYPEAYTEIDWYLSKAPLIQHIDNSTNSRLWCASP